MGVGKKLRNFFSSRDVTQKDGNKKLFKDTMRALEGSASMGGTELNRKLKINYGQEKDVLFGGKKKHEGELAHAYEQDIQNKKAANEAMLLERANSAYGVGLNPEAQANASRMNARRAAAEQQAFTSGQQQADQEYASGLSDVRGNLARSGLVGSGVEAQARNDLMARYFGTINQAQQAGKQAGRSVDDMANTNRLALRGSVRGGQITDTTGLGSEIVGLNSQASNSSLWENAAGKFLPTAAQNYSNNRLSAAYGRS